jgi:Holliday junction resolvase RusA-like endonuclease
MKTSREGCQKRRPCSDHHGRGNDAANNDDGSGNPHVDGTKVIAIDDSSECDKKPAAFIMMDTIVRIDSSSEEELAGEESSNVNVNIAAKLPRKRQTQRKEPKASQGGKRKKNTIPAFTVDSSDPFLCSSTAVSFVVRGKPRPQYRDKPGWNFTRYNPGKQLQKEFRKVALIVCAAHSGFVPNFGTDANIKVEVHFCFPSPKTGHLKNTADIDNLVKFVLDACNETFYGDDGQVVRLTADKCYDDSRGGTGFTSVTIESSVACSAA